MDECEPLIECSLPVQEAPISPEGIEYKFLQSSVYGSLQGTYQNLTNNQPNSPGAATSSENPQWMQAEFPCAVNVTRILLGAPTGPGFVEGGWASVHYIEGKQIQFSNDGNNWEIALEKIANISTSGTSEVRLPSPTNAKFWRITSSSYIAIGCLIFK